MMTRTEKRRRVVELRDKKKMTFEEIAKVISEEEGAPNSKQGVYGLYKRHQLEEENAKALKDKITSFKVGEKASDAEREVLEVYALNFDVEVTADILCKTGKWEKEECIKYVEETTKRFIVELNEIKKSNIKRLYSASNLLGISRDSCRCRLSHKEVNVTDDVLDMYVAEFFKEVACDFIRNIRSEMHRAIGDKDKADRELKSIIKFAEESEFKTND